jgi:hypothetical protein
MQDPEHRFKSELINGLHMTYLKFHEIIPKIISNNKHVFEIYAVHNIQ